MSTQKNLAARTPAEVLTIAPEALEVANTYLQYQDIKETARLCDIPTQLVAEILSRREVKAYIDEVFINVGFNNRFKARAAMDALLSKKFAEMEEADVGSSKDITELMALSHKMTMDHINAQIKLEELKEKNIKNQLNVQINNNNEGGGSSYEKLLHALMGEGRTV